MSRFMLRPSLRLRLTLTYSALFVVAGAALLSINYVLVSHRERKPGTAVQLVCTSGAAAAGFFQGPAAIPPDTQALPNGCSRQIVKGQAPVPFGITTGTDGQSVAAQPPPEVQAKFRALTRLATQAQNHTLHTLEVESAIALGVMALASLGLGWLIAGRALRPVHHITNTARQLSEETLHERINLEGADDELKELADTFDAMLDRLDRAFASQKRFVANASHELRTPLATERVLIDEALANRRARPDELRSILTELRANNERTESLIDALLVLARSQRGVESWVDCDLAELAARITDQATPESVTAAVELRTDLHSAPVSGDPVLLERLAGNLVENAIRHNVPPAGWASITTGVRDGRPYLRVANSGRVLAPEQLPQLLEPFSRAGAERTSTAGGFGLGLSIVRSVVDAHGGELVLGARPEGGLDVLVLLLPAAARPGSAAPGLSADGPVPARV